uniref:Uncharacterized protein n=1 Tax=Caenorhabditis tropicalis TaxID=1561998 RepID=A0A1I7TFU8_9PELO
MINGTSSSGLHQNMQNGISDDMIRNSSDCQQPLDPYELESRKRAQIERNNEWIEKMSPIVKYKIQEYIRKQKAKKMQRRKFSLACGFNSRIKQETMNHHSTSSSSSSSSSSYRRRTKKNGESSLRNHHNSRLAPPSTTMLERNLSQPEMIETRKSGSISNRRKSAPAEKMDMRDLDDLE